MSETEPYSYDICGLDNVHLTGGVGFHKTPYGDGVSIADAYGLHAVLARFVLGLTRTMTGIEHHYLRTQLELAPDAEAFRDRGLDESVLRAHEKNHGAPVPEAMDAAIRAIAAETMPDLIGERQNAHAMGSAIHAVYRDGRWTVAEAVAS